MKSAVLNAVFAVLAVCWLLPGWAAPAPVVAQQQAGGDGRALDANQQAGSGGINQAQPQPDFRGRNDVITGNVGGGRAFQGDVNYRAPGEFRDQLGSDDLFRFRTQSYSSGLNQLNAVRSQRGYAIGDGTSIYRSYTPPGSTNRIDTQLVPPDLVVGGHTEYRDITDPGRFDLDRLDGDGISDDRLGLFSDQPGRALQVQASPLLGVRRSPYDLRLDRTPTIGPPLPDGAADDQTDDQADDDQTQAEGDALETRIELRQDERLSTEIDGRAYQLSAGVGTSELHARQPARLAPGIILGRQLRSQVFTERADVGDPATQQYLRQLESRLLGDRQAEPGEDVYADLLAAMRDPEARAGETGDRARTLGGLEAPTQRELDRAERARQEAQARFGDRREDASETGDPTDTPAAMEEGEGETGQSLTALLERLDYELPRLTSLAGERDDRTAQLMKNAEQALIAGDFFDAEDIYRRVLRARPSAPLARVGLVHAQLGAGLLRSAGLQLRGVLADHPELVAAKYDARLLPSEDRIAALQQQLQQIVDKGGEGAGHAALLLAYLGYQGESEALVRYGLDNAEAVEPRDPLLPVLRRLWLSGGEGEGDRPDQAAQEADEVDEPGTTSGEPGVTQPTNQGDGAMRDEP